MARKTQEQKQALADMLGKGIPVSRALVESGYTTPTQAKKAMAKVPADVLRLIPRKLRHLIEKGKSATLDEQQNAVIGRLLTNIESGKDGGAQSAKILGSRRGIDMFVPDSASGAIVLSVTSAMSERLDKILEGNTEGNK